MVGRYVEVPIKIKLSKLLLCSLIRRFKHSRWFEIKFWWGLYKQFRNHFLFLKLTVTERVSMLHFDLLINNLANSTPSSLRSQDLQVLETWNLHQWYILIKDDDLQNFKSAAHLVIWSMLYMLVCKLPDNVL